MRVKTGSCGCVDRAERSKNFVKFALSGNLGLIVTDTTIFCYLLYSIILTQVIIKIHDCGDMASTKSDGARNISSQTPCKQAKRLSRPFHFEVKPKLSTPKMNVIIPCYTLTQTQLRQVR